MKPATVSTSGVLFFGCAQFRRNAVCEIARSLAICLRQIRSLLNQSNDVLSGIIR
jgi:hypothetical protein